MYEKKVAEIENLIQKGLMSWDLLRVNDFKIH
jgi:hypothetical protein